jgi:hypothetical protein
LIEMIEAQQTSTAKRPAAIHNHPRHWRLRIALLVLGTILSIAMAIFVAYWGGCAIASAPYARAASAGARSAGEPDRPLGSQETHGAHRADKG